MRTLSFSKIGRVHDTIGCGVCNSLASQYPHAVAVLVDGALYRIVCLECAEGIAFACAPRNERRKARGPR